MNARLAGAYRQAPHCSGMASRPQQNVVGPMVAKLRNQHGWTQAMLAARCARIGWDVGDNLIAKVEAQIRCVTDFELIFLARALGVEVQDLIAPACKRSK